MKNIRTASHVYIDKREAQWLTKICRTNGLARAAAVNFVLRLQHLEKHHGCKFVVDKLKELASAILNHGKLWRGDYRPIMKLATKNRLGLRRALRISKIYGRWTKVHVTQRDHNKFVKTVMLSTIPERSDIAKVEEQLLGYLRHNKEDHYLCLKAYQESSYRMMYPKGPKKSPALLMKNKVRDKISPAEHVEAALRYAPGVMHDHYSLISGLFCYPRPKRDLPSSFFSEQVVGVISPLTKDGGLKVRYVANPLMVFQVCLTRLKMACKLYLQSMPESNVFHQDSGESWVKDQFKQGYSLTSLDLSSCSDLLPADPQFALLKYLFPYLKEDIDLFKSISRSYFILNRGGQRIEYVKWTIGQPLGTEPSFFSFTIFLIWVVRSCGGDARSFRVVGDDLIMRSELTERVTEMYGLLKVPINMAKSLFNHKIGEFTGRLVDIKGSLGVYTGRKLNIKADPLGFIRQYGYRGAMLIPKRFRKMCSVISLLPEPIGLSKSQRVFTRISPKKVDQLYGARFKKLKRPNLLYQGPEQQWLQKVVPYASFMVSQMEPNSYRVVERLMRFFYPFKLPGTSSVNLAEALPVEILAPYKGVGSWLVREMNKYDPQIDESIVLFNELIDSDPRVCAHEPLMQDIHYQLSSFKQDETVDNFYEYELSKKRPLIFIQKIWKKIARLFPGKITFR